MAANEKFKKAIFMKIKLNPKGKQAIFVSSCFYPLHFKMEKWNLLSFFRTIHSQLAVSEENVIAGSFEDPASRAEPLLIG